MKGNKILLIFCGLIIITFALTRILSDDIRVTSLLHPKYEKSEVEIIDGDNFVKYASNLNSIKDITWLKENIIQFQGKNKNSNKFQSYKFDYDKKKVYSKNISEEEGFYHKDFRENLQFVKEINSDNFILYTEGEKKKGLFYVRKDKEPITLAENIKFNDELLFKISENKKKIVYYDTTEKSIKVYDFSNNNAVKIEQEIDNEILNDFKNNISFSYEAGYLTIANVNREDFKDSSFSVYGADSGKLYAENLLGINPVWNKNNLTVAFTYIEDNSVANRKDLSAKNLVGDRVGFYNLKTRRIKYIQNMGKGFKVIRPVLWNNDNEILIIVGKYSKGENKYLFNRIYSYTLKNNALIDLAGYFKDINNMGDDFDIVLFENYLYISSHNKEQEGIIKILDLISRREQEFKNIQDFITNGEDNNDKNLYKCLDANTFLYVKGDGIYITDLKSNYLKYKTNGTIIGVYESPDKNCLFVVSKLEEGLELTIVNL